MSQEPKSLEDRKFRWERARFLIASVGGAVLFLVGLWQFAVTSRNEFAKPVLEQQMKLCIEASESAALLAFDSSDGSSDWRRGDTARKYLALYYGKLGVVEDRCLYDSMVAFKSRVFDGQKAFDDFGNEISPSRLALTISFACRRLLSKHWSSGIVGLYDPHHLFESFSDLEDYRNTLKSKRHCVIDE